MIQRWIPHHDSRLTYSPF